MVGADARDSHLLPQVGAAWMPQGTQEEGRPPGKTAQHARAGARPRAPGKRLDGLDPRKNPGVFRDLLTLLDTTSPAAGGPRREVVADHDCMHTATAVAQWCVHPPRLTWRWFPMYGPRANPIERAFGDVHDTCPRNHQRQRWRDVVQDGERPRRDNGPWKSNVSQLSQDHEVTAAVEHMALAAHATLAA